MRYEFAERFDDGLTVLNLDPDHDGAWSALGFVYDKARDASDLVILDASEPSKRPVAGIEMPRRVPHGVHGSWIRD